MKKDPTISAYFENLTHWKKELSALRKLVLAAGLTEECKWKHPCYTLAGANLIMLGDFKGFCSISFFQGALLNDPKGYLQKGGEHTQTSRILRFTNLEEIKEQISVIQTFIQDSIKLQESGLKPKKQAPPVIPHPVELIQAFKNNSAFKKAFSALTPGRQRDYLILFTGSEESATRAARIERATDRILKGYGRNDCTCGLSKRLPQCDGSHKQLNA